MVKLIACDMDGTLLTTDKQLPGSIREVIGHFHKLGILFVIASGRQYDALRKMFIHDCDKLAFICDNGGFLHIDNQYYANGNLDQEDFDEIISRLKDFDVSILFSGSKQAYAIGRNYFEHKEIIAHFYPNHIHVDKADFSDKIGKIAIMDKTGELPVFDIFDKFLCKYTITKSEERWFDIMKIGVNKGKAIKKIQELKNITYEETMVFGDMMNDYDMMQSGYYSYAMGNAVPEIKRISRYITDTNDNQGVIKALEKHFNTRF